MLTHVYCVGQKLSFNVKPDGTYNNHYATKC